MRQLISLLSLIEVQRTDGDEVFQRLLRNNWTFLLNNAGSGSFVVVDITVETWESLEAHISETSKRTGI